MAFKPVAGSTPPDPSAPSTGFKPVALGVTPEGAPDDSGSPSLFGFLGNVGQEIKDMAQGITSLGGAILGDVASGFGEVVDLATPGGSQEHDYKLDDIAMALPKALAQDYDERYGISKFAEGDIWGGLSAILTGLYERPLSAVGDALMVGSAVKWTAKSGMLGSVDDAARAAGDTLGARILGPGAEEAATLTGASNVPQVLSQNPVARLAQRKLYEAMSYGSHGPGPQGYIQAKVASGATDEAIRAMSNLARAAGEPGSTPMRVLRPTVSKFIEKRGVNSILAHMGMGASDKTVAASQSLREVLEPLDDAVRGEVTSVAMGTRAVLPDAMPSNATSVDWVPRTEPPGLPDAAELGLVATPGTSPRMLAAAQDFGSGFGRKHDLFDRASTRGRGREIVSPHDFTLDEKNAVVLETADMDAAYDVAKRYADDVGGRIIARHNYTADPSSSYDGMHYFVQDPDGAIHDVSVATPELKQAQEAWSHMALQANEKQAAIEALESELNMIAREGGDPASEMKIAEEIARLDDELQAIEAWNSQTFNYTRRMHNKGEGSYDEALAAVDRIRNVVYNHATRHEVKAGLTYRKMLDRAFGPIRAEKWSRMMRVIEEQIAARLERAQLNGVPKDEWDSIVLSVTDEVLGENNPFAEAMFRTKIRERIPFQTEDVMPQGLGGTPGPLRGVLDTGERTIDPRPYATPRTNVEGAIDELADEDIYGLAADEIAHRLTQRLREVTHKPMVENGEMRGLTWTDLMREQVTGGLPVPTYFPHIKASNATADVAIINQHRASMKTVLEGQDARMKKWGGWLYEQGKFERDPITAYEAMFRQVQRHMEFREAMQSMIDKYGRKVSPEELVNWDLETRGEVLVSRAGLDGMIDTRSKMITLTHENVMAGESLETATMHALDAVLESSYTTALSDLAVADVWALPKYVAQQMKTAAKLQLPGTFNFYYDSAMGMWKSAALSMSPRWVVNNTLGNSIYMGMSRPGAIRHFVSQLMPGARARFRAAMGDDMLAAVERDFMHGEDLLSSTQKLSRRAERADVGWGKTVAAQREAAMEAGTLSGRVEKGVRGFSRHMRNLNKYIEGAARRGVAIDEVRRMNMTKFGSRFLGSHKILDDAVTHGIMNRDHYDRIISSVNNVLGDYLTMSPVESQIIRRFVMPFYAFYRHTAKFMARMPFEHPLKVRVLEQIAEIDRQMNPYMPDYMLGVANIAGLPVALGGANPLEAISQAYAPSVSHPLLGLAVQRATGTNPFGGEWYNEPEGTSVELFGGDRYVIHRNPDGTVSGVQPAGKWAPPLYEALLGIVPQAALIFDPWDRAVARRIAGQFGVSSPKYDPETSKYYAVTNHLEALRQAMRTPPP